MGTAGWRGEKSRHMIVGTPPLQKTTFSVQGGGTDNALWTIQRESTPSIKGTDAQLLKHVGQTIDHCSTHACFSHIPSLIGPQWWSMVGPCWSGRGSAAPHRSPHWAHSSCDGSPVAPHPLHTPDLEKALVPTPQLKPTQQVTDFLLPVAWLCGTTREQKLAADEKKRKTCSFYRLCFPG